MIDYTRQELITAIDVLLTRCERYQMELDLQFKGFDRTLVIAVLRAELDRMHAELLRRFPADQL